MKTQDKKYWAIIDEIGWGQRTDYENIGKELEAKYSKQEIESLYLFVKLMRAQLVNKLNHHAQIKTGNMHGYYGVSDDGYWDLTAHIVGLGKFDYYDIYFDNPDTAKKIASEKSYKENFEYIFTHAYKEEETGTEGVNNKEAGPTPEA